MQTVYLSFITVTRIAATPEKRCGHNFNRRTLPSANLRWIYTILL
jgi:hypothetical protein